LILFINLN